MPESRKRKNHPYRKPADIPASQRVKGHVIWSVLCAVFGGLVAFFASDGSWRAFGIGVLAGAAIGYFIGRKMEKEA